MSLRPNPCCEQTARFYQSEMERKAEKILTEVTDAKASLARLSDQIDQLTTERDAYKVSLDTMMQWCTEHGIEFDISTNPPIIRDKEHNELRAQVALLEQCVQLGVDNAQYVRGLEAALEPFARMADGKDEWPANNTCGRFPTVAQVRTARQALAAKEDRG